MDPNLPTFTGLLAYRNLRHRFSLLYPEDWPLAELDEAAGGGTALYPDAKDPHTFVLVKSRRLRSRLRPDDLEPLREGFLEGLRLLPGNQIESEEANSVGALLDLQARHSFREGDATRRRWTRVLYQGTVEITLIAQGAGEQAFTFWLPAFNTVMRTVRFGDWWAEMTGQSWQRQVYKPAKRE